MVPQKIFFPNYWPRADKQQRTCVLFVMLQHLAFSILSKSLLSLLLEIGARRVKLAASIGIPKFRYRNNSSARESSPRSMINVAVK